MTLKWSLPLRRRMNSRHNRYLRGSIYQTKWSQYIFFSLQSGLPWAVGNAVHRRPHTQTHTRLFSSLFPQAMRKIRSNGAAVACLRCARRLNSGRVSLQKQSRLVKYRLKYNKPLWHQNSCPWFWRFSDLQVPVGMFDWHHWRLDCMRMKRYLG